MKESNKTSATIVSNLYTQGGGENDWIHYNVTLNEPIPTNILYSGTTSSVELYSASIATGDTILVENSAGMTPLSNLTIASTSGPNTPTIASASYNSKYLDVGATTDGDPFSVFISPNGTKLYVMGNITNTIYQYTLSTPWAVNTATYDVKSLVVTPQDSSGGGIWINPTGTLLMFMGRTGDSIDTYYMATPWDISTATVTDLVFSVTAEDTLAQAMSFSTGGHKMYMIGSTNKTVYQYDLGSEYLLSSAAYASKSFSVNSQDTNPLMVNFNTQGTKMFVLGATNNKIFQYSLATAWDVSTASYDSVSYTVTEETAIKGFVFNNSKSKMYVTGATTGCVFEYDLPDLLDNTYTVNISSLGLSSSPTAVYKKPAKSVYLHSDTVDNRIISTDLTIDNFKTAGSSGSATFTMGAGYGEFLRTGDYLSVKNRLLIENTQYDGVTRVVTSEESAPFCFTFSRDGTKMYIHGQTTDRFKQYNLSTPWNIGTASYYGQSSFTNTSASIRALWFDPTGTILLVGISGTGQTGMTKYTLTVPWDITSMLSTGATYYNITSGSTTTSYPITFSDDGTIAVNVTNTGIFRKHTTTTPFNFTTTTTQTSADLTTLNPFTGAMSRDGTKLWYMTSTGVIRQHNLSTPWDLSTLTSTADSTYTFSTDTAAYYSLEFGNNYSKVYSLSASADTIYQSSLPDQTWQDVELTGVTETTTGTFNVTASNDFSLSQDIVAKTRFKQLTPNQYTKSTTLGTEYIQEENQSRYFKTKLVGDYGEQANYVEVALKTVV